VIQEVFIFAQFNSLVTSDHTMNMISQVCCKKVKVKLGFIIVRCKA